MLGTHCSHSQPPFLVIFTRKHSSWRPGWLQPVWAVLLGAEGSDNLF